MRSIPSKLPLNRQYAWYGEPADSGRCPISGGINRVGNKTQINDTQAWTMEFLEYPGIDKIPAKMPGWAREFTSALPSPCGGRFDFRDNTGVNHAVVYSGGTLYEIDETANTTSVISVLDLPPANVSMCKLGDYLIVAYGGTHLKKWDGTTFSDVANSPAGATWVVNFKNRLWCNMSDAGVARASNAGQGGIEVWDAPYSFNLGRTSEVLNAAVPFHDWLLVFQDNQLDAFNPGQNTIVASIDTWLNALGCPSPLGVINCDDIGVAFYSTEGIKFFERWSPNPQTISGPIQPLLDAIPADMRSKVALGFQDGKLRVSYADETNGGANNRELICHIKRAMDGGGMAWTGPHNLNIGNYYTRLENNGTKNELVFSDSVAGMSYLRTEGVYTQEASDGTITNMGYKLATKYAQPAPLGYECIMKGAIVEVEGVGVYTISGQVDNKSSASLGGLAASALSGLAFPLTLPFTFSDAQETERTLNIGWPRTLPARAKYVSIIVEELSASASKVIAIGLEFDTDSKPRKART